MALYVTERQATATWYELSGELEASEVFPNLLPNSDSIAEVEDDIQTEPEETDGQYDGCDAEEDAMENEIAQFIEKAVAGEFHYEALNAAKAVLKGLKPGETLRREHFEDPEQKILDEAATALAITTLWDPDEAAEIQAEKAAEEVRRQQVREQEALRKIQMAEVREKAIALFKAGNSHAAVRAMFPGFECPISALVGELRSQGLKIAPTRPRESVLQRATGFHFIDDDARGSGARTGKKN